MNREEARKILEVTDSSTDDDIKKAFRKKAAENHPDRNNNSKEAEEKFKQINQAYRILTGQEQSDDAFGGFAKQGSNGDPFGVPFGGVDSLFNEFFKEYKKSKQRTTTISNIVFVTNLTFEESVLGCKKDIKYKKKIYCDKCEGQGKVLTKNKCNVCNGKGSIGANVNTNYTNMTYTVTCNACGGSGYSKSFCDKCSGAAFKEEECLLKLVVPPLSTNTEMIARNKGNQLGNISSNLVIHVIPSTEGQKGTKYENFYIDGKNVYSTVEIGFDKLIFGGETDIDIVGSDEKQKLHLSQFTKLDSELVIQGFGLRLEKPGNHIVQLKLKYPPRENIKSKEDLEQVEIALRKLYNERSNG